jgi:uncharacterized protein YbjT (DUF2867 family)
MIVLVAGAHGRLGGRVVGLLLSRGHTVRALVRTQAQADALASAGAEPLVADLRGDVEWTADGCDAAIFAAGARHRAELSAIDAGGAAKLAEAADRYELTRFVLCSALGAGQPERRQGPVREFLAAKHHAERRLERLDLRWTVLRFGRLSDEPGGGAISTTVPPGTPVFLNREDRERASRGRHAAPGRLAARRRRRLRGRRAVATRAARQRRSLARRPLARAVVGEPGVGKPVLAAGHTVITLKLVAGDADACTSGNR